VMWGPGTDQMQELPPFRPTAPARRPR
jgi:hypothetical protein